MNELMNVADEGNFLLDFSSKRNSFCTFNPTTQEEKIDFYNQVNTPQKRLKEMINMEITLKHVYAETITFIDTETGEGTPGVRMVFIDDKGVSYQAASKGVYSCTQKLFQIFGMPSEWKKPVKIRPREISKGPNSNVLVFEIVK